MYVTIGLYFSIIHVFILIQKIQIQIRLNFLKKKLIFTPVRCYRLLVLVYWYLLMRILVEPFVSERLIQSETATKMGKKDNKNYSKIKIKID